VTTLFRKLLTTAGAWAAATTAMASEGPWTTAPGLHNVYAGLFYERFQCFTLDGVSDPTCGEDAAPVPTPVQRTGVKLFYRTGLTSKLDVAASAPLIHAFSGEADNPDLATTTGVGLLQARLRRRIGSLGPLDLAAGAGVESGFLHRNTRGRITNIGDGVTSLQASAYAGATGLLGPRFYTFSTDLSYSFRLPEAQSDIGRIPGDELRFASVMLYAISSTFGLGVSIDGQFRMWGEPLDFAQLSSYGSATDSLRWAALDASQLKLGSRLAIYPSEHRPYLQLSAHRAIWSVNNPTDTTLVEVAVGFDAGRRH